MIMWKVQTHSTTTQLLASLYGKLIKSNFKHLFLLIIITIITIIITRIGLLNENTHDSLQL